MDFISKRLASLRLCRYFEASVAARFRGFSDDIDLMGCGRGRCQCRMAPVSFGNVASAAFGFARSLWLGLVFLAAAGAASSANCSLRQGSDSVASYP
jgi:hypothetical protein